MKRRALAAWAVGLALAPLWALAEGQTFPNKSVKSSQITGIASNDAKRSSHAPDVPAIAGAKPKFDFSVAIGVLVRAGTPPDSVKKLSDEIAQAVKAPEVIEKITTADIELVGSTSEAYAKIIEVENAAMAKAGKAADLKADQTTWSSTQHRPYCGRSVPCFS